MADCAKMEIANNIANVLEKLRISDAKVQCIFYSGMSIQHKMQFGYILK